MSIVTENKKLIAPSILSANLNQLAQEVSAVEKAGADWIHVDVMDGHFVPNITFGPDIVRHLRQITHLPIDVHLMVEKPQKHIESFIQAGANSISVHFETLEKPLDIFKQIKKSNVLSGLAVKPQTPIENIFSFLKELDFVLIMMVEPGLSGQKLMTNQSIKIQKIKNQLELIHHHAKIEVDGGVNNQTLEWVCQADILVAGHHIFKSQDYSKAICQLRK